ncbi:Phosphatase [Ephemeroptericola cinctiostellae]|uniref:Phosphatase n=1 Tax=Ephemeroptericola cinctiostellae TaxID=2268024 RepID=A0A345DCA9_9BURK|nr:HAD-IA family hydrolase [Ephemeroptericola cinctiostellae]AXF85997.1 Phosphatase [Ephemeroptericola cinctiostellae]
MKALVLDFGGVISRTLFETHDLTEVALNLPRGTLTWQGPFDPANDILWTDMQADKITERDYWMARTTQVGELIGQNWTMMEEFVQAARGAEPELIIRPEAVAAIQAAKAAGCRLAILSNELDLFYGQDFSKRLPLLKAFDVVVDATYTHILKPDARAYATCIEALGIEANDCIFVDDQLRNIKGGLAAGMQCVHFDVMQPKKSYADALSLLGVALPTALE